MKLLIRQKAICFLSLYCSGCSPMLSNRWNNNILLIWFFAKKFWTFSCKFCAKKVPKKGKIHVFQFLHLWKGVQTARSNPYLVKLASSENNRMISLVQDVFPVFLWRVLTRNVGKIDFSSFVWSFLRCERQAYFCKYLFFCALYTVKLYGTLGSKLG